MARKKNISKDKIIDWYMNLVIEEKKPKSVQEFSEKSNFNEPAFFDYFNSISDLEKTIFKTFATETIILLNNIEDFNLYTPKNKLLSFYFTFFEMLTANRSYVLAGFKDIKYNFTKLSVLSKLHSIFINFIYSINIETLDFKNKKINNFQDKTFAEGYWLQLLMILKFWIDDTSLNFEKTDVFIEKYVKASFDLHQITPVKSVLDLVKFILKEKTTLL